MEFWKIIWERDFENWNFAEWFEMEFLKLNLKIGILEKLFENGSFENWNFEELFENEIS